MPKSVSILAKKNLNWLVCFLFVSFFSQKVLGYNQFLGGEIYYQYISGSSYRIYYTVYHQCVGIFLFNNNDFAITDGNTTLTLTPTKCCTNYYTTGIPSGQCTRCMSATCPFPYGYAFDSYYADVDVNYFKGCKLTISWSCCCFNGAITTGAADDNFYISTILNRCNGEHSSPVFEEQAMMIVNNGKLVDQYQTVTPANNGDSIYYHLVNTFSAANTSIPYVSGYAYNYPLKYTGSLTDAKPKGFHYGPHTGEVYFTPQNPDQSFMSLEADEYARDKSGKWYLAGSTVRTNVVVCVTINTNNNMPVFTGTGGKDGINVGDTIIVCAGKPVSFQIDAYDFNNPYDTLTLSGINNTSGNLAFSSPGYKPAASFSWTPSNSDISPNPYQIIITATDNVAPISDLLQASVYILVKDSFPDVAITHTDSGCGRYYFVAKVSTPKGLTYQWYADGKSISRDTSAVYTFPDNGIHVADLQVANGMGCLYHYYDTIRINILPNIRASGGKEICTGSQSTLSAAGGIQYTWYPSTGLSADTGASITASPVVTTHYYVAGTDSKGCVAIDTA